ncbi:hypothetical protein GCM10009718_03500 [Isoptericola halotolerans]|uniref:DUF4190 domain-containing protein n=1 Tax=Isoptericola halotolerans TaxID=300560 RepID=A0ABX2A492_9MICO|nr:DUF4190 domain-containing protein [Isoptericola halotolerans]NOV96725.1 hypothetical protein [Isoptericola halotolerans]
MTTPDPNTPQQQPTPPPGGYPAGPPAPAYGQPPVENPGKTLGIVGLVLGFLGPLSLVGLILSIVGLRKSKKVGQPNGIAIAGIIVSSLVLIGVIIGSIALGLGLAHVVEVCNDLGPGTHVQNGVTYTCG